MRRKNRALVAIALALALLFPAGPLAQTAGAQAANPNQPAAAVTPAQVEQPDQGVNWPGAGYGVAALFCNVVYIPAKLVYALAGGFVGGATWALTGGNSQAADTVWRSTLGGDYVLTPQMISGDQPINFNGPTETPPPQPSAPAASTAVAPIAPLPPPPSASASSGSTHPIDVGSGPVAPSGGSPPASGIE
ncbi:MAG TPA: hypothetical protein VEC38_06055 [Candidatus Binataceae bacterium]|nr:hypothetical protein [Candidatus Binataceae bacterium]